MGGEKGYFRNCLCHTTLLTVSPRTKRRVTEREPASQDIFLTCFIAEHGTWLRYSFIIFLKKKKNNFISLTAIYKLQFQQKQL